MDYTFDLKLFLDSYITLGFFTALIFFYMVGPEELQIQREANSPKMPHWVYMIIAVATIIQNWPLYLVQWNDWDGN